MSYSKNSKPILSRFGVRVANDGVFKFKTWFEQIIRQWFAAKPDQSVDVIQIKWSDHDPRPMGSSRFK